MSKFKCECGKALNTEKGLKIHKATCKDLVRKEVSSQSHSATAIESKMKGQMQRTKEYLDKQPKVSFYVPLDSNETEGAVETVQVNGYTYTIKKGETVNLPEPVARMIANKYNVKLKAGREKLLNRDDKVVDALSE